MDILKILGQKDSGGQIPVNVTIGLDPTVQKAIKTAMKGFAIGMGALAVGIIGAAAVRHAPRIIRRRK